MGFRATRAALGRDTQDRLPGLGEPPSTPVAQAQPTSNSCRRGQVPPHALGLFVLTGFCVKGGRDVTNGYGPARLI